MHDCFNIEVFDRDPDVPNDASVFVTERFPDDVASEQRDAREAAHMPEECPLCAVLDDCRGSTPSTDTARAIMVIGPKP